MPRPSGGASPPPRVLKSLRRFPVSGPALPCGPLRQLGVGGSVRWRLQTFPFFPPKRSQPVAGHGHSGTRNDPAVAPGEKRRGEARRGEGQLCRALPPSPPRPSSLRPRPAKPGSCFQPRNCSAALQLNKPALCCWLDGKYFPFLKRRRRNCSRLSSSSLCGVIDRL